MKFSVNRTNWEFQPSISGMDPIEQALRVLEADMNARGWDLPPTFFVIMENDLGIGFRQIAMPDMGIGEDVGSFVTFFLDWLTKDDDFPAAFKERAFRMSQLPRGLSRFKGLLLVCENWTLDPDKVPAEEFAATFQEHRVHQHPLRQEVREGTAYLVDGGHVSLCRVRDQAPEYLGSSNDPGFVLEGRVPRIMGRFVETCQRLMNEYE